MTSTTGTVTTLSDGTFNVPTIIVATEDNVPGPGTHQSTYQGYYIVVSTATKVEEQQWTEEVSTALPSYSQFSVL
jgi:hypothetical protein